jgi:hypothetical protein
VISQCSLRVRKEDHKKITECRFWHRVSGSGQCVKIKMTRDPGCTQLPARSALSRFLTALDKASVEAPLSEYLQDALSCIHCLNQRQKTSRLHAFLPLIPSCGEIGHALSLAELGTARSQCTTNLLLSKPVLDLSSSVERVPLLLSTPSFPMDHVFAPYDLRSMSLLPFPFFLPLYPSSPRHIIYGAFPTRPTSHLVRCSSRSIPRSNASMR